MAAGRRPGRPGCAAECVRPTEGAAGALFPPLLLPPLLLQCGVVLVVGRWSCPAVGPGGAVSWLV